MKNLENTNMKIVTLNNAILIQLDIDTCYTTPNELRNSLCNHSVTDKRIEIITGIKDDILKNSDNDFESITKYIDENHKNGNTHRDLIFISTVFLNCKEL